MSSCMCEAPQIVYCCFWFALCIFLFSFVSKHQEEEDEEATYARELEAETKGKSFSDGTVKGTKGKGVKRSAEMTEQEEDKELAKIMMSKKHKQLYSKIMHGKSQKKAEVYMNSINYFCLVMSLLLYVFIYLMSETLWRIKAEHIEVVVWIFLWYVIFICMVI